MKKLTLFILNYILFGSLILFSQNSLTGIVKNMDTMEPIEGAHVFIPEMQKGTVTNMDGEFQIQGLPSSSLNIEITHVGFKTLTKNLKPSKNNESPVTFFLEPTVIHSDAVVVSAGTYSTQHENAIKIETLKSEDFVRLSAVNLVTKLAEMPGVDMISKGNGVVKPVIRGLSNSNILVLNNGIKLENFQFSENHPFLIDELGVDRVEVIKGPASLLYGSDAVGGIINLIGEKPASTNSLEAEVSQKYHLNTNGYQTKLGIKRTYDDFYWGMSGGIANQKDFESGNDQVVPNSRFENTGFHLFTGLNKTFGSFRINYDYTKMLLGMTVPGVDTLVDTDKREQNYWYQNLDNHLIISKNRFYIGDFKLETDFSFQQNSRKLFTFEQYAVDMLMSTYTADIRGNYSFNSRTDLIVGAEGNFKENQNAEAPNRVLPDHETTDFAFNTLLQHDFSDKLKTQAGIRWDYRTIWIPEQEKSGHSHEEEEPGHDHEEHLEEFKQSYDNFSFSAGATYRMNEKLLLRSNVASAYRTPNVAELTQEGVHGARYEVGNRNLNSQRNVEADLSMHYHCCHALLDISGFYNRVYDYIFLAPTGNFTDEDLSIYQYEQTDANLFGGELNFEIQPTERLRSFINYSITMGERMDGTNLPFIPQDKLNGGIIYKMGRSGFWNDFSIRLSGVYAFEHSKPSTFETETSDYFLTHLKIEGKVNLANQEAQFGVAIDNLFDVQYINHLSTLKPLNYYNMGRNIVFSLKIPINYNY